MTSARQKPKTHYSPFIRVKVTDEAAIEIRKMQEYFHSFWKKISKNYPRNTEEANCATRALQEACMYATRALAIEMQHPDNWYEHNKRKEGGMQKEESKSDVNGNVAKETQVIYKKRAYVKPE